MTVVFENCADQSTKIGDGANIASSAQLASDPGYFSKIGDGAVVGQNSNLGSWSSVGHFAKVGNNVEFGPWASVGMCAVVDSKSNLGSHEFVRSGHRRLRNGKVSPISGFSADDLALFQLYDSFMGSSGPSAMSNDEAKKRDEWKLRQAGYFLERLPAFLEQRKMFRQHRPSLLQRLFSAKP